VALHEGAVIARGLFALCAASPFALGCGASDDSKALAGIGFLGVQPTSVWAGYYRYEPEALSVFEPHCSASERIGACFVARDCPRPTEPPTPTFGDDDLLDPGEIVVAGVSVPRLEGGGGAFVAFSTALPFGEKIPFSVSGSSGVPAHGGDFVIPPTATITEPDISAIVVVDRTRLLVVRWMPVEVGTVSVSLSDETDPGVHVSCTAPTSAGALEMPVEVLGHLPARATAEGRAMTFVFGQSALTQLHPGDWLVNVNCFGATQSAPADVR